MRCFCKRIRTYHVKVVLLDEQELIQEIQDNSPGQEILDTVFRHLNLLETAYFGLRYLDASNQTHWLDPTKKIVKQLKGTDPFTLYFGVKFYAADPCKLLEEITRYQFFLQVKQDILQGRLPVTFDLAAELGSYVVQSELGDYDPRRHSPGYVSEFRFLSNQTVELESRIAELHKGLVGQLPAMAELSYLDKVKWLEMYGVDLHPVLGEDNVEYFLGLTPSGIIVLRNKNKVGNYYWPRITKIYFKGRYFMLRVCDKNNDENTYGFETPSKPACKHLWKCCVEHHAFFRLVQVSPTAPDIFALGSRFRYSGRTEKQAQRDAQMRLRSPPQFTRTPSRRYQRRIVEGAQDAPKVEETVNNENIPPQEMKAVSIPQPAHSVGSLYRSTCSIPAVLPSHGRADSPRSTRSAPWTQPHVRGLYSSASPRSVRSAGNNSQLLSRLTRRSSSVESQSSNDSRSCKRHRHHRSRRGSDNESELSKCSGKSHGHRRHRHRSHGNKRDSGSEQDHHRHRHKGSSRHRHGSHYELVDSEAQWKEVQRKQAEGGSGIHQATVVTNRRSGYMNSGMETESEHSYHHKRKQKKHRSRSRSPSENKPRLPDELKRHLEFDLIDTEGMTEAQLREIPYKVVETTTKSLRVKMSPSNKQTQRSPRRTKSCSTTDERCPPPNNGDSPPPPYSPPQAPPAGSEAPGTPKSSSMASLGDNVQNNIDHNDNAGQDINKNSGSSSASHSPAGSLRSRSNNNNNNNLPRMSSGMEYGSIQSRGGSRPPLPTTRALGSALYDNPGTLLGKLNGHVPQHQQQYHQQSQHHHRLNINNLKSNSHEHSDSGLSAESHDYSPYGSERLSEGPRYAHTTKLTSSSSSSQPPLPSLVSTSASISRMGLPYQSRPYAFNSMRVSSSSSSSQHHTSTPQYSDTVHRQWDDQRARGQGSGRLVAGASSGGGGGGGSSSLSWMSPGAPPQGSYRTLPNSPPPNEGAANLNNNWNGSVRSTRSGEGSSRRGPLYFRGHQSSTSSPSSSILRDSNKFNTASVISSGWTNETPATIREDDESQDALQNGSPAHKIYVNSEHPEVTPRTSPTKQCQQQQQQKQQQQQQLKQQDKKEDQQEQHSATTNGVQEVVHEMSTEL